MNTRRLIAVTCAIAAMLALSACGRSPSTPTALEIAVTTAKDATKPLSDASNVGSPASGRSVYIRAMDQQAQGGQPVYIAGKPLFTLRTGDDGTVRVELPPNRYLVEVLDAGGNVAAKQFPQLKGGQTLKLSFNVPPQ
jgi:hypothetical protein